MIILARCPVEDSNLGLLNMRSRIHMWNLTDIFPYSIDDMELIYHKLLPIILENPLILSKDPVVLRLISLIVARRGVNDIRRSTMYIETLILREMELASIIRTKSEKILADLKVMKRMWNIRLTPKQKEMIDTLLSRINRPVHHVYWDAHITTQDVYIIPPFRSIDRTIDLRTVKTLCCSIDQDLPNYLTLLSFAGDMQIVLQCAAFDPYVLHILVQDIRRKYDFGFLRSCKKHRIDTLAMLYLLFLYYLHSYAVVTLDIPDNIENYLHNFLPKFKEVIELYYNFHQGIKRDTNNVVTWFWYPMIGGKP